MSDADLIRRLGGAAEVSRMLGGTPAQQTVQDWIARDRIPRKHHDALFEACERCGKALHPTDFFHQRWHDGTSESQRKRHGSSAPAPARKELAVVEQPLQQDEVPDVYDSGSFRQFLTRYEKAQSDLHESQAELRELYKAETDRGLNRAAAKIALAGTAKS